MTGRGLFYTILVLLVFGVTPMRYAYCQSIHFSQYYNAPMLLNPANTALMPEYDYRLGINFRNQWAEIPVPYNTFSAFGDLKIGGNKDNKSNNNWLGLGFAIFNDKAGDGNLSLMQLQGSMAYHLQMSEFTMLSLGFSGAYVNRSVNYDLLTFNNQWDGFVFNSQLATGEKLGVVQTNYITGSAGLNFAWFPNEAVYCKLGGSVANINQPVESFYAGKNTVNLRPSGNLDMFFHTGRVLTINPSIYFATQNSASELLCGAMGRVNLSGVYDDVATSLILGGYLRLGDAAIGVIGIQRGGVQFMVNYDMTISTLSPYNATYGALEMSLIYQGLYSKNRYNVKGSLGCPRFF